MKQPLVMGRRRGEDGQVMVLTAVAMMGLIAVIGLVADGGSLFSQRRDLQNAADAAALAGAMQVDIDAYRASGAVLLDPAAARAAAIEYLQAEGDIEYLQAEGDIEYAIRVSESEVEVTVSRQASTSFLRLIGIGGIAVSASSWSAPRHGIEGAER